MTGQSHETTKTFLEATGTPPWMAAFLPAFVSSFLTLAIFFFACGLIFKASPSIITILKCALILVALSLLSAVALLLYRSANWQVRALLAPSITFCVLSLFGLLEILGLL